MWGLSRPKFFATQCRWVRVSGRDRLPTARSLLTIKEIAMRLVMSVATIDKGISRTSVSERVEMPCEVHSARRSRCRYLPCFFIRSNDLEEPLLLAAGASTALKLHSGVISKADRQTQQILTSARAIRSILAFCLHPSDRLSQASLPSSPNRVPQQKGAFKSCCDPSFAVHGAS